MIRYSLVVMMLASPAWSASHQTADCATEIGELQASLNQLSYDLNSTAPQAWNQFNRLQNSTKKFVFFESELNRLLAEIRQFKAAENDMKRQIDWVDGRIDYLFTLPQNNSVMSEIFQRQNQQATLMSQRFEFTTQRGDLRIASINLRRRVDRARDMMEADQQVMQSLSDAQNERQSEYAVHLERFSFLQSLEGVNACSEADLVKAQAEVAAKELLLNNVEQLRTQALALEEQAKRASDKIKDLMDSLNI
jgi:hypothetical protein